jgi:hypothetical protein
MQITEAQREVRTVFIGGFVGQAVSSGLWLASAAAATWGPLRRGIVILALGGAFWILGGLLVAGGVVIGLYVPASFILGGWVTGAILLVFAFVGRSVASAEQPPVSVATAG